jgi:hypothetical protein
MRKYSLKNAWELLVDFLSLYRMAVKYKKYLFSLSGFYYCKKLKTICVLLRFSSTRKTFSIPLYDVAKSMFFIKKLHPINSFYLGFLFSMEQKSAIEFELCYGLDNAVVIQNKFDYSRMPVTLVLHSICHLRKCITLKLKMSEQYFHINSDEILKNEFILASIEPIQAFHIGYSIFDFLLPEFKKGEARFETYNNKYQQQ